MSRAVQKHQVEAGLGPDREPVEHVGAGQPRAGQLRDGQGRDPGLHQDAGDRARPVRHHDQRGGARVHRDRHDPADRRAHAPRRTSSSSRPRQGDPGRARRRSPRTSRTPCRSSARRPRASSTGRSSTWRAGRRHDRASRRRAALADVSGSRHGRRWFDGRPGAHRRVRRRHRGPPVDPRRPGAGGAGPVRRDRRARVPDAVADPVADRRAGRGRRDAAWWSTTGSTRSGSCSRCTAGSRIRATSTVTSAEPTAQGVRATFTITRRDRGRDQARPWSRTRSSCTSPPDASR